MMEINQTQHVSQRILGVLTLNNSIIDEVIERDDLNSEASKILIVSLIIPSIVLTITLGKTDEFSVLLLLTFGTLIYSISFMTMFRYLLSKFVELINVKIDRKTFYRIFSYSFVLYPLNSFFILFVVFGQPSNPMYGLIILQVGFISMILKKSIKSNWMIIFTFFSFLIAGLLALTAMITVAYGIILIS
ncbi:MAG: hypothetical protein HeimC2_30950 [Candidatus Heimdallarchaeota archaeon LC_2]|nr:MAG: hypothetical protein HeimC2_30950 [Candidatus Heimdallarchaeota archaeon LC_2]